MYLNTAIQQHIIQFTAFDAHTKQILKEVFWSNSSHWRLHDQTGTRILHTSIRINSNIFTQQRTT
jgi:hypothetical protein